MTETRVARVTGVEALACVALSWLQFPLWVIGAPPSLVRHARPESEWLDTLRGGADASAVRALVMGTVLIYNGSIAFAITGSSS